MNATLSSNAFEKALTVACMRAIGHAPIAIHDCNDALASAFGATVKAIAKQSKLSVPQTRRRLQAMHLAGTLLRYDREGGSTTWWPVGLAALHKPVTDFQVVPPRIVLAERQSPAEETKTALAARDHFRQTVSHLPARQHWSNVLGVPRDCSTSEARQAFTAAVAALDQADPDYPNQNRRVRDAIDACCREHEIQIEE